MLTYIEISMENCGPVSKLVRFEVRLHVGDLHVSLVRFQFARIHRIRVFYYDYVLRAESFRVKVLESREYLGQLRQSWLLVDELFAREIAESGAVEADSEIRPEDAFTSQLLHTRVRFVKFSKNVSKLFHVILKQIILCRITVE